MSCDTTDPAAFSEKVDKKNGIFAASCPHTAHPHRTAHTPNTTSLGCAQKIASDSDPMWAAGCGLWDAKCKEQRQVPSAKEAKAQV
jgi:hypothetical protein